MKRQTFSISINAPAEKVWNVLWNDQTYRIWTTPFCEGSYAVSDWKQGSKVLFLSPSGEGMSSVITKKNVPEQMFFTHLYMVKEGKEQPMDAATQAWSGAVENYTLRQTAKGTDLTVEMDLEEKHAESFRKIFPQALEKVKELSENS